MIAPLAKFLDWSAVQATTLMLPANFYRNNPKLDEALEFLSAPELLSGESRPAQVEFNGLRDFHFPTPRPCAFPENNIVHGRFYRSGKGWQERPVVVLLHGSGDSLNYRFLFPRVARRCNEAGFTAVTLAAPYHFQRRPRQLGGLLSYSDLLQFAQATAQAMAEIRAMTGWLLQEGCPAVALWGYSMGAWYAGMVACHDARLAAVVLGAASARMHSWVEKYAASPRIRSRLPKVEQLCENLNLTPLNLTRTRPVIPKENILLIEGTYDFLCPKDDLEDLWQLWGQPDIWRLPYGHVGICCGLVPGLNGRILRWLAPRLNAAAANHDRAFRKIE
jgi:pimeloyl-ACP methyl ester carboxylesterase